MKFLIIKIIVRIIYVMTKKKLNFGIIVRKEKKITTD